MIKNKIIWNKPDYKNEFGYINNKDIDNMCFNGSHQCGDVKIEKEQCGREIKFIVYRVEKVGIQVEGIDVLSRQRAIEELKKLVKNESKQKI